jgi:hypothetical protein
MPTVLRVGGFKFGFFPGDHEPPHLHVRYAGRQCRIVLGTLDLSHSNMNHSEESRATRLVAEHHDELLVAWLESKARREDKR